MRPHGCCLSKWLPPLCCSFFQQTLALSEKEPKGAKGTLPMMQPKQNHTCGRGGSLIQQVYNKLYILSGNVGGCLIRPVTLYACKYGIYRVIQPRFLPKYIFLSITSAVLSWLFFSCSENSWKENCGEKNFECTKRMLMTSYFSLG